MKTALVFGIMVHLFGINASAAEDTDKSNSAKPCVAMTGTDSHVSERGYERVLTLDEWVRVWQKHKGKAGKGNYDFFYDPLKLPLVDFDRYMVIAIFRGSGWNCAGLTAESVTEKEDSIIFRFGSKPFQTSGPDGGGKKVSVFGFFVIPRSTKPVILEEKVLRLRSEQVFDPSKSKSDLYKPEWQERIKFEANEK